MDTFTAIIVYYAPNAPPELPFPPPQNSKLRQAVNALKGDRVITPHLHFIRGARPPPPLPPPSTTPHHGRPPFP